MQFSTSLNLFSEKSLTQQMLEKTHQWNTTGLLVNKWVVSRVIGSLGVACASLIDAMRETSLTALTAGWALNKKLVQPGNFFFSSKTVTGKDALIHLRKAAIHVAVIFAALSLGVIAPSGLLNPAMVKMGFDLPYNGNLLNKIKAVADRMISKRTVLVSVTLIGLALAGAWASKRYIPIPDLNRPGIGKLCATIAVGAFIAGTVWKFRSKSTPKPTLAKPALTPTGPTLRSHESRPTFQDVYTNEHGIVTQRNSIVPGSFVNLTALSNGCTATISYHNGQLEKEYLTNPNRADWSDNPRFFQTMQEHYYDDLFQSSVRVVDIWSATGECITRLTASDVDVRCIAPLQDGGFATASATHLQIWSNEYKITKSIPIKPFNTKAASFDYIDHLTALQGGGFAALCMLVNRDHTLVVWSPTGEQTVIDSDAPLKKSITALQNGGFLTGDIHGGITFHKANGTAVKHLKLAEDWTHITHIKQSSDGVIVAVEHTGLIHWLSDQGEALNRAESPGGTVASASIAEDGSVTVGMTDMEELRRVSRNGDVVKIFDKSRSLSAALPNGRVAMVTADHCLAFFSPNPPQQVSHAEPVNIDAVNPKPMSPATVTTLTEPVEIEVPKAAPLSKPSGTLMTKKWFEQLQLGYEIRLTTTEGRKQGTINGLFGNDETIMLYGESREIKISTIVDFEINAPLGMTDAEWKSVNVDNYIDCCGVSAARVASKYYDDELQDGVLELYIHREDNPSITVFRSRRFIHQFSKVPAS